MGNKNIKMILMKMQLTTYKLHIKGTSFVYH